METPPQNGWRIVLIDDEADIREVMSLTLRDAGYHVDTAADGKAGLALINNTYPQIVVTDIRMPQMGGLEVLEKIKQSGRDTEVIVVTAFGDMDLAIRALQQDASDFITKPINDTSLHLALQRARERYTARKQVRDYTALLEREIEDQARILHRDKMVSLGRLAASVIHEINNPLAGVLNYIRLMSKILKNGPLAEDRQEKFKGYLDLVESETDRCSQILSSLLTFSRKTPLTYGEVDTGILINKSVMLCRHKIELSQINLLTELEKGLPTLKGNFNQLQQCIINLIFNAIDAMPAGGKLYVTGRQDDEKRAVVISIRDTGKGIPEMDLPYIFEPFFTTKSEGYGVGLGLSTTYGIVEEHGGVLTVENSPGKGCTFNMTLPVGDPNRS